MKFLFNLKQNSIKYADRIAYKVESYSITYKKLWEQASYYGEILKKEGTSPVIIYGNKSINILVAIIACLIAKRSYVPVDFCTPLARIKQIVSDSSSSLIITDEELDIEGTKVFSLNELSLLTFDKELKNNNDIAYIIFTSGSTGKSKGVQISYDNLDNFIDWISNIEYLSCARNWKVLNQASFSFDLSVADLYYSLNNGHTLCSLTRKEQDSYSPIFEVMKNEEINFVVATPTFFKMCLLNKKFNFENYPKLCCIYFCGEVLDKSLVRRIFDVFPNIKIINAYGPTEATSAISYINIKLEMLDEEEMLPVGDMNSLATEVVLDNEEIVLKGKSVSKGYLGYQGGFYKEGDINCFKTGDLGFIKDNKLYCLGRKDNQIKYMGYRIELEDVEENIKNIAGVLDCAVIAKLDCANKVKLIKAFVVLEGVDLTFVKEELKRNVPSYMMPKVFEVLDKLPINANGKIDRKVLSEL